MILYNNDFSTPIPAQNLNLSTGATCTVAAGANWDGVRGCAKFTPHINPWQNYYAFSSLAYTPTPVVYIRYCVLFGPGLNYPNNSGGFKHLIVTRTSGTGNRAINSLHSYRQVNGSNQYQMMIANNVDTEPPGNQGNPVQRYFEIWNPDRPDLDQVGKWVCFEVELDRLKNRYCLYATTRDGSWRDERVHEMQLNDTTADFGGIDILGLLNEGIVTQDATMFFYLSDLIIATEKIGPPRGFVSYAARDAITAPSRNYSIGETVSPDVALPIGATAVEFSLTRGSLPEGLRIGRLKLELSFDGATTWDTKDYGSMVIDGGVYLDGAGQVVPVSTVLCDRLPQPRNPLRRARVRLIRNVAFRTAIGVRVL